MKRDEIDQMIDDGSAPDGLVFCEGFDGCIVGVHWQTSVHDTCVVYDRTSMVEQIASDGVGDDDADEFFEYNIAGSNMGRHTPIYCATE